MSENIFTRAKRAPGLAYRIDGDERVNSMALDVVTTSNIVLDTGKMAASAVISNEQMDRDADIVVQSGLDFSNYERNPVVFWNHAKTFDLPIGRSQDPDGRFTVIKSGNFTTATCYFSQSLALANQIYHLIADGTLKATSLGFLIKYATPVRHGNALVASRMTAGRQHGFKIEKAEVTEWSWVGIGCNPGTLLTHLQKGIIAGSAIDDRLRLSLQPFAAEMEGLVAVPDLSHITEQPAAGVVEKSVDPNEELIPNQEFVPDPTSGPEVVPVPDPGEQTEPHAHEQVTCPGCKSVTQCGCPGEYDPIKTEKLCWKCLESKKSREVYSGPKEKMLQAFGAARSWAKGVPAAMVKSLPLNRTKALDTISADSLIPYPSPGRWTKPKKRRKKCNKKT